MSTLLTVEAPVRPSEDEEKVRRAMLNLFPDLELRLEDGRLVGRGASLARFGQLLKRYRIRDAARGVLMRGLQSDRMTVFRLAKQAAFMEKVSFSNSEAPLGDLTVRVEAEEVLAVIDGLAPDTRPPRTGPATGPARGGNRPGRPGGGGGRPEFSSRQDWRKLVEEFKEEE